MGIKSLIKEMSAFISDTAAKNKAFYYGEQEPEREDGTEEVVNDTSEISALVPEMVQLLSENESISIDCTKEALKNPVDFDGVCAPWMQRTHTLEEELENTKSLLEAKELDNQELAKLLVVAKKEIIMLLRTIKTASEERARLESESQYCEYYEINEQIILAKKELFSIFSQIEDKKSELKVLEKKLLATENKLKSAISKSVDDEQASFLSDNKKE